MNNLFESSLPATAVKAQPTTGLVVWTEDQINDLGSTTMTSGKTVQEKILTMQRASSSTILGPQLNNLLAETKNLDPEALKHAGGVLSFFKKMVGATQETLQSHFDSVQGRIDKVVEFMDKDMVHYQERMHDYDALYQENINFYQGLQEAQVKGKSMVADLDKAIEEAGKETADNSFAAAKVAELKDRKMALEKRIDNFARLSVLAEQSAPNILFMKQNARGLIETYNDLKTTTLPAWTSLFIQTALAEEQKKTAEFQGHMYDTTDQVLRRTAELQGQVAVQVAENRQRSVISTDTLEYRHNKLLETIAAVQDIEKKGIERRAAEAPKLKELSTALIQHLT
jgi:uncharacterized protein YaaN involved in tellurite resistance